MKKLITILAIAIVLVGAVFATDDATPAANTTENHTITVKTHVTQILPVFSFKTANNVATNTNDAKFSAENYTANDTTVILNGEQDISQAAISQVFKIMSMKKANYVGNFKLTVSATQFKHSVVENNEPIYTTNSTITITYPTEVNTITADHITVTPTAATEQAVGYLTAAFRGRQDNESVELASVTVAWSRDINALPGDYTADVKLEVKVQ